MGELIEWPAEPPEDVSLNVIRQIYGGLLFPNEEVVRAMAYRLLELLDDEEVEL